MTIRLLFFLLLLALVPRQAGAQTLSWARTIHETDTGPLTAGAMDEAGNLYLASLIQSKPILEQPGLFSLYAVGDLVLSKWSATGELLWRREFPNNKLRVFHLEIGPDQSLIMTGGYVDTFFVAPGWLEPGLPDNSSFFLAKTDLDGNFQWMKTEVSDLGSDHLGVTLAIIDDRIYVSGYYDAVWTRLAKYDLQGTLLISKVLNIRTLSDLETDGNGNLYAAGTASNWALFDTLPLPDGDYLSGYLNYVVRLDTSLNALWARTSSYITFDDHPKLEWFNGRVLALTHDFHNNTWGAAYHKLRAYQPDGSLAWTDSLPDGPNLLDPFHFGLKAGCGRLWLQYPDNGGMKIRTYDTSMEPAEIAFSSDGDFEYSFSTLLEGGGRVVWGSSFRSSTLTINDSLELHNPNAPTDRQVLASFQCGPTSGLSTGNMSASGWEVFPNPASTTITLHKTGGSPVRNAAVTVFDSEGTQWLDLLLTGENSQVIPIGLLPPGAFFMRVEEDGRTRVLPFMVF